jgi:hypothetical protein
MTYDVITHADAERVYLKKIKVGAVLGGKELHLRDVSVPDGCSFDILNSLWLTPSIERKSRGSRFSKNPLLLDCQTTRAYFRLILN